MQPIEAVHLVADYCVYSQPVESTSESAEVLFISIFAGLDTLNTNMAARFIRLQRCIAG
jgi:hypothetical protein